jgi:hypothetical protein
MRRAHRGTRHGKAPKHAHKPKAIPHPRAGSGRRTSGVAARARTAKAVIVPPSGPEPHERSLTALAAEAMRREPLVVVSSLRDDAIPREGRDVRGGDPDQSILENEYVGDDQPGRTTPAPDPNDVDEIGRAYGVQEEDSGALRSTSEILDRRDHHRPELIAADKREDRRRRGRGSRA